MRASLKSAAVTIGGILAIGAGAFASPASAGNLGETFSLDPLRATVTYDAAPGEDNRLVVALVPSLFGLPQNVAIDVLNPVNSSFPCLGLPVESVEALGVDIPLNSVGICPLSTHLQSELRDGDDFVALGTFTGLLPVPFNPGVLPYPMPANIGLGAGNDFAEGSANDDVVRGGDGRDTINGRLGRDNIRGDFGNDTISGGFGGDRIRGGPGNDRISGGPGNDRIAGNAGADTIDCGSGTDTVVGPRPTDVVRNCEFVADTF